MAIIQLRFYYFIFLIFTLACSEDLQITEMSDEEVIPKTVFIEEINFARVPVTLIASPIECYGVAFKNDINGEFVHFSPLQKSFPYLFKDNGNNRYDLFGRSENGIIQLEPVIYSHGYWFGWSSTFPIIEILNVATKQDYPIIFNNEEWDIPGEFIFKGAEFDAIDGLVTPGFIQYDEKRAIEQGFYLQDEDIVIAVPDGNNIRVYPHKILNYHEIVNDVIQGKNVAIIYSPFTSTSTVWSREIGDRIETFGSSGMVFNSNILPFDRRTQSIWSQLLGKCVSGFYRGTHAEIIPFIETKWSTIKKWYKSPLVLNLETGFNHNYNEYPFADYESNNDFLFSPYIMYDDTRFARKKKVFGIVYDDLGVAVDIDGLR